MLGTASGPRPRFSAIVPAHDEQATIAAVVFPLLAHPMIDEVIVVDDGSTDATASLARAAGARVVSLPVNSGKAEAMSRGVAEARNNLIFFCDADVTGLSLDAISRILTPVLLRDYGMYVGIRARRTYWANRLLHFTPILGGERALSRALWDQVPPEYKRNFQIEIALNFFAKTNGHRMGFTVVKGLGQVIKERKRGLVRGLAQRLAMIYDIVLVSWRIYAVLQTQILLARRPREPRAT
jgi:glycosyltransferase involved in cell wall biosynthesis